MTSDLIGVVRGDPAREFSGNSRRRGLRGTYEILHPPHRQAPSNPVISVVECWGVRDKLRVVWRRKRRSW